MAKGRRALPTGVERLCPAAGALMLQALPVEGVEANREPACAHTHSKAPHGGHAVTGRSGISGAAHGISLANAENAAANVSVLVSIVAPRPSIATAPSGSGLVMMPTIVPRKMASRCQACTLTPAGGGSSQMTAPTAVLMPRFFMSAPHLNCLGARAGAGAAAAAEDAATTAPAASMRCARRGPRLAAVAVKASAMRPRPAVERHALGHRARVDARCWHCRNAAGAAPCVRNCTRVAGAALAMLEAMDVAAGVNLARAEQKCTG